MDLIEVFKAGVVFFGAYYGVQIGLLLVGVIVMLGVQGILERRDK